MIETYAKIYLMIIPIFLLLTICEKYIGVYWGMDTLSNHMDTISSFSSGITKILKDILGLSFSLIPYSFLVNNFSIFEIKNSVFVMIFAFIVVDFAAYWTHRLYHKINFLWNQHLIHHSSEEFNFATALRQSISGFVNFFTIFLLPAALVGIPYQVITIVIPTHLFLQFWYHTQQINKLGFLEKIIVTPSHHRVHHAINKEYIDKNFSQIFIIWDKLFGTFKEEDPNIEIVYGVTKPVQTWNPIKVNFIHFIALFNHAMETRILRDKLCIWFMPVGWRPSDTLPKNLVSEIANTSSFKKYNPKIPKLIQLWAYIQMFISLAFTCYIFTDINSLSRSNLLIHGIFIYLSIYAYTELIDGNIYSVVWETVKNILGIILIYFYNYWLSLSLLFENYNYLLSYYFISATFITYFLVFHYSGDLKKCKN